MNAIPLDNYARFGVALAKITSNVHGENAVWREVVKAHMALNITDPVAIQLARRVVENHLSVRRLTAPSH